jgi:6-phosphogluconolactonase
MMKIFENTEALSQAAAELFVVQARTVAATQGQFSVLLSGGKTPRRTYELLAQEPHRSRTPWQQVHFFWGDERCVPSDDPRRNELMARKAFLDALPLEPKQLHPMVYDGRSPRHAAEHYEAELRRYFAGRSPCFDLVFLGLGEDGHIASLLPHSEALTEQVRWTAVTQRPDEAFSRVTLTLPVLNQAALVVFLVTGGGKAEVVRAVLKETDRQPLLPAQLIHPLTGTADWFVDSEAACLVNS